MTAGKFRNVCLQRLNEVAAERRPVVITKQGRPVTKLVPITKVGRARSLVGSIVSEKGDPFGTREVWNARRP